MIDIRFLCPACKDKLSVAREGSGKIVSCPLCRTAIKIPDWVPLFDAVHGSMRDYCERIRERAMNIVDAVSEIRKRLDNGGYGPATSDFQTKYDLSWPRRVKLVVNTNAELFNSWKNCASDYDSNIHEAFPSKELIKSFSVKGERDWQRRWDEGGGYRSPRSKTKMIAEIGSPVWDRLSVFGNPYPPFDFESGFQDESVDAEKSQRHGIQLSSRVLKIPGLNLVRIDDDIVTAHVDSWPEPRD